MCTGGDHRVSGTDVARALRSRGEYQLGFGNMRIFAHEMVFDQPGATVAQGIGKRDFRKSIGIDRSFAAAGSGRHRKFVKQVKLHSKKPVARPLYDASAGPPLPGANLVGF